MCSFFSVFPLPQTHEAFGSSSSFVDGIASAISSYNCIYLYTTENNLLSPDEGCLRCMAVRLYVLVFISRVDLENPWGGFLHIVHTSLRDPCRYAF